MEKTEIEALLKGDETLQAYLAEQFVAKTDFDKVNSKKEQILGEKKKLQDKYAELETQSKSKSDYLEQIGTLGFNADEVLPQLLETLKSQVDIDPAAPGVMPKLDPSKKILEDRLKVIQQTYESKINSIKKDYEGKLTEQTERNGTIEGGWNVEKIENTLLSEMDRIGVAPSHRAMLRSAFRNRAEVSTEDGVRSVLLTNDDGLKTSATEFFNAFAETDNGKLYIAANTTTGGGAIGGKNGRNKIDFNAERSKALKSGKAHQSVSLAMSEFNQRRH